MFHVVFKYAGDGSMLQGCLSPAKTETVPTLPSGQKQDKHRTEHIFYLWAGEITIALINFHMSKCNMFNYSWIHPQSHWDQKYLMQIGRTPPSDMITMLDLISLTQFSTWCWIFFFLITVLVFLSDSQTIIQETGSQPILILSEL